jgi:hypothetical protein
MNNDNMNNDKTSLDAAAHEQPDSPDTLDQELLVAYLDDELTHQDREAVENRLSSDEPFRQKMQRLQTSWDMLEHLPLSDVSDSLTRTTLEMVSIAVSQEMETVQYEEEKKASYQWIGRGLSLLLAAGIGYLLFSALLQSPNRRLVRDLPLVAELDVYRHAGDIDFVEKLRDTGLFSELVNSESEKSSFPKFSEDVDKRSQEVEHLTADQKQELDSRNRRFTTLPADEKEDMRQLHDSLKTRADPEALFNVMANYDRWLRTQPTQNRIEIEELPTDDRITRIKQVAVRDQQQQLEKVFRSKLTIQDMFNIRKWLEKYFSNHRAEIHNQLPAELRKRISSASTPELRWRTMMGAFDAKELKLPNPTEQEIAQLRHLRPEIADYFDRGEDTSAVLRKVRDIFKAMLRSRMDDRHIPAERLRYFYTNELTATQREELENMPMLRMQEKLKMLFIQHYSRNKSVPTRKRPDGSGRNDSTDRPTRPQD